MPSCHTISNLIIYGYVLSSHNGTAIVPYFIRKVYGYIHLCLSIVAEMRQLTALEDSAYLQSLSQPLLAAMVYRDNARQGKAERINLQSDTHSMTKSPEKKQHIRLDLT